MSVRLILDESTAPTVDGRARHSMLSLSRVGNAWDNAAMERFFSPLKTERTADKAYRTRDAARAGVFDDIERSYNRRPDIRRSEI